MEMESISNASNIRSLIKLLLRCRTSFDKNPTTGDFALYLRCLSLLREQELVLRFISVCSGNLATRFLCTYLQIFRRNILSKCQPKHFWNAKVVRMKVTPLENMPTKKPFELRYARNLLGKFVSTARLGLENLVFIWTQRITDFFPLTPLESCLVKGFPFPTSVDDCLAWVVPYFPAPPSEVCLNRVPLTPSSKLGRTRPSRRQTTPSSGVLWMRRKDWSPGTRSSCCTKSSTGKSLIRDGVTLQKNNNRHAA